MTSEGDRGTGTSHEESEQHWRFALGLSFGPVALVSAAETSSPIPDFSGVWGRNTIDYTAPDHGKGPVQNISGSRNIMIGDFHDPMLKPWAAEIVRRNGDIARTGAAFPPRTISAGPNRRPIFWEIRNSRCCSKRIR